MLGRLRMTIDESIHAFTELMEDIFAQGRKGLPFDLKNGKVRPRYSSSTLETAFKNVIMKAGFNKDALFRWRSGYGCYTFVVALTELSTQPVAITDYEPPHEQQSTFYNGIKIWEAARATSAATSFFKPIKIEVSGMPRNFVDGGIGWNNPINTLLPQAGKLYPPPATLRSRIRVILSVGTGVIPPFAIGATVPQVVRTLVEIATETEHTASDFHHNNRDLVDRGAYYRFNPPYLNEIALDQAEKKPLIAERCELYGSQPHVLADMERWAIAAGEDFSTSHELEGKRTGYQ
ncbi:Hypothetical protein D9617_13g099890 [Elsinoe fawcettii]|nr:Hypothetical protein D9617_13g099890 [Elsinoe fawcettii]